jgi:hypothetical protein
MKRISTPQRRKENNSVNIRITMQNGKVNNNVNERVAMQRGEEDHKKQKEQ